MGQEPSGPMEHVSMRKFLALTAFAVLIASAGSARASLVTVTLTGVNGASAGGVFVDPYFGQINGGPQVNLFCDDFAHDSNLNTTYTNYITSTYDTLANVRFAGGLTEGFGLGPFTQLQEYDAAAFLVSQMTSNSALYADGSFALWAIFDFNDVQGNSAFDAGAQALYKTALTNTYTPNEFSNFEVVTPTDATI